MARKKKCIDDRKQLLIRYRINKDDKVSFIDPCCDDMPARLFCNIMEAISNVEKEWNDQIDQPPEGPVCIFIKNEDGSFSPIVLTTLQGEYIGNTLRLLDKIVISNTKYVKHE